MRIVNLIVIIVFLLALSLNIQAQVRGRITDNSNGNGIAGVHVLMKTGQGSTVTNLDGYFEISDVKPGEHKLELRCLGYETKEITLTLDTTPIPDLQIRMSEAIIMLKGASVESFTITGGMHGVKDLPGSAHYIDPRQLDKFGYNDIGRVLRSLPGVNIQDEDGFGLRPNIGLRGTGSERSSKITLMEDGILIAPAPYAAPSAYYFPSVGRMQGVEVRKGSSQIKYGPYTTGGAINMISTTIPDAFFGRMHLFSGSYGQKGLHAFVGDASEKVGFLVETYQAGSDGFKELPNGENTGYKTEDYLIKFRVNTSDEAKIFQSLTLKAGRYFEDANETYLGLTDIDFEANPLSRYAGSQVDNINTDQSQLVLSYYIQPSPSFKISTSMYRTTFARNWYKLDKVKATDASGFIKIANILADANTYNSEYQIITGVSSSLDDALAVKANNRSYWSNGVQTMVQKELGEGKFQHLFDLGLRYHVDQIDRFQWIDFYSMSEGVMELNESGIPGTESNRIETAKAAAGFIQYTLKTPEWVLVPGLRYENIVIDREDYGKADPSRTGSNLSERSNHVSVVIPGIGIEYIFNPWINIFSGIHKGFSPPGSKAGTSPESSINYELGLRMNKSRLEFEALAFYNDYENLLGADLAASGGNGTGDLFNGGAAEVYGTEFNIVYRPSIGPDIALPISLAYTFTHAQFDSDFDSDFDAWGQVQSGDEVPYIAPHQLALNISLEHRKFNINLSSKYTSRMRTVAGSGEILKNESTDESFIVDLSGQYNFSWHLGLFAIVKNLTNSSYIVSRRPAGVRPGMPRNFSLGVKANF